MDPTERDPGATADAITRAFARTEEVLQERTDEVQRLRRTLADYEGLGSTLRELPERVEHEVMVPLGKLALFPGVLRHTNEMLRSWCCSGRQQTLKITYDVLNTRQLRAYGRSK